MSVSRWLRDQLAASGQNPRLNSSNDEKAPLKSVWDQSDDENDDFVRYMQEWTHQCSQRVSVDMNVPHGVRPNAIHYSRSTSGKDSGKKDDNASDDNAIWRKYLTGRRPSSPERPHNDDPLRRRAADDCRPNRTKPFSNCDQERTPSASDQRPISTAGVKNKFSLKEVDDKLPPVERDFDDFEDFKRELDLTLNSKFGGYTNVDELASNFQADTGVSVSKMAKRYGFSTFEAMLRSNMLRTVVRVERDAKNKVYYLPHSNPRIEHIREAQNASQIGVEEMNDKWERQRLSRIYQPGVQELLLEGRMRLVKLAGELGAEHRYVDKKEICDRYQSEYGTQLNKEELRRLFYHPSLLHIFSTVCAEEFEVNQEESYDGRIYVKMRQSLNELHQLHAEWKEKLANGKSIVQRQKMPKRPKKPLNEQHLTFVPILPTIPI